LTTRLPNGGRAVLDVRKIEDYCLNPAHPVGRHKARVFREALGIGRDDSAGLVDEFLEAARTGAAAARARMNGVPVGPSMSRYRDKTSAPW
jgi:hypothetical protein